MVTRPDLGIILRSSSKTAMVDDYWLMKATGGTFSKTGRPYASATPTFIPSMIAKFVNASTIDGYNPYRVTQDGIDWEVEDLEDPWSYIGYWGDHQIIYLLKFLELSEAFYPDLLTELMTQPLFSYANVPYRLKPFDAMVKDPKNTVLYDEALAKRIERRVSEIGADGKLILTQDHEVYQVTLLEKLLVPMLSKLSNLVVGGGIWLNTQRPEWNDGNNALVGSGVSFVTLCYLQRYTQFLKSILASCPQQIDLTDAVGVWLACTNRDPEGHPRPQGQGKPL